MLYSDRMRTAPSVVSLTERIAVTVALLVILGATSLAQSTSAMGSVTGTVLDPQSRPIADAKIVLRNTDFTSTRSFTTDEAGRFIATFLPVGPYTLQVTAAGFDLKKPVRLNVGAGSSTVVEVRLSVKSSSQSVTVTGTGATVEGNTVNTSVNRTESLASNQVAGLTVTYLPSRNRDFTQMTQLAAATEADPDSNGIVIAGQRPESLKLAIDGADFDDPLRGGVRGAEDGALFFPQVVVREVQIVRSGATAEVGGTNAGFVNVATKSGANKVRGEAFYIARPAAFGSRDPFGHSLENRQHLLGGSIGGPIKKDRAFFYIGLEQDFLRVPYWTQFAEQAPGVPVSAALASQQLQIVSESNPTALFGRTDFNLGAAHTLNLQLNYNHVTASNLADGFVRTLSTIDNRDDLSGQSVWGRASLTSVLSTATVNHILAAWQTDHRAMDTNATAPEIFINGFGVLGGSAFSPNRFTSNTFQLSDDLSFTRGKSSWSVGGFLGYAPVRDTQVGYLNSRFDFSSLSEFVAGNFRRYRQSFVIGDPTFDESVKSIGAYVSVKQPITDRLTVTAGLRWEAQLNPQNSTARVPNDVVQVQPRFGLAWNPKTNTVIRLSAGLYDANTPVSVFQHAFTDDGANVRTLDSFYDPQILPLVASLQPLISLPANTKSGTVYEVSPEFRNPRSLQSAVSWEQQLNAKVSTTLGYVHNSTWALERLVNRNLLTPTYNATGMPIFPAARPDLNVGEVLVAESNGHSDYNAFTLTSVAQLPKRSQLTINYTVARSRDNGSRFDPFQPTPVLDPFNPSLDAGYSDFDIRHNLNISAVFNLPKGFKANPVLIARSGAPFTPILGFDTQGDGLDFNDRAVLNGRVSERNGLRQPAFATLDLRFVKDFTLKGEGHHLDLFLDVFNLTGAANFSFGSSGLSFYGDTSDPVFTSGRALFAPAATRSGGPRTVQLTARLVAF